MGEGTLLDLKKTVHENAAHYYEKAKDLRRKAKNAVDAMKKTEREIGSAEIQNAPERKIRIKREKHWYERFHWFKAGEFMVLAGRDAKQNEILVSRYFEDKDLFFHADIHGAPTTILRGGTIAPEDVLKGAAQFAASYSSAWKQGMNNVDVYAVERNQVSKEAQGEYVGKGGFIISGKRRWFRNTELSLVLEIDEKGLLVCEPAVLNAKPGSLKITPGNTEKGKAGKDIANVFNISVDDVLSALPSGSFSYRRG
ncbi:MAG: NFACT RNA binding domain-containing protein [Candidatus Micrarchaeota archaeon]